MTTGPTSAVPPAALPPGLPVFAVEITPPDLSPYIQGNTGIPGFTSLESGLPGPHVVLVSLIHGNEFAGAIVLAELLAGGFKPLRGKLTLGFANLAAFAQFDPKNPIASRFVEEDMNRVWDDFALFGVRRSAELERARAIKPIIDSADMLLDLHTMLWPSDPVLLCGAGPRGRALGMAVGTPALVVADTGHAGGKRLIDYGRFTEDSPQGAACLLVEAGPHWRQDAVDQSRATVRALLRQAGMLNAPAPRTASRFAEVVALITARTNRFVFVRDFRGGEVIAKAGTLIAHDGDEEIRTPEDNLIMIMPSLKVSHGHTAARLARPGTSA
ncbi:MAG TPA: succinylglutamate desuccinylase/aspartoacylase family protein [Acidocella sp.]|nr:succinylglutamate desuccinylase/aspartoacylase family protein [Acidocella sp.]